ncbi:MAG: glycerol-3-phosphate 1-O-acyltransferase PlsY [Candidatus Kapaibacteriota bacterium]
MLYVILGVIFSYFLGSFPTAVIISKVFFGFDIRTRGSGNMGSTNAFRQLGIFWGVIVQIVDILKGFLASFFVSMWVVNNLNVDFVNGVGGPLIFKLLCGFSAIAGHIWSIYVGFKGGKGINTALGMFLAVTPFEILFCLVIFSLVLFSTGYVSLGSLVASFSYPIIILLKKFLFNHDYSNFYILFFFSILLFILVLFTHRSNIDRLLKGVENRFENLRIFRFKK